MSLYGSSFPGSYLKAELGRLVHRWQTVAALHIGCGALGFGYWQYAVFTGSPEKSANGAFFAALRLCLLVIPIVSATATGDVTAGDRDSGAVRYILLRVPRRAYALVKMLAAATVAGGIVFLAILFMGLLAPILFPVRAVPVAHSFSGSANQFFPSLLYGGYPAFVGLAALYSGFFGVFVGGVTAWLGLLFRSAVVVTAVVWVGYMFTSLALLHVNVLWLQRLAPYVNAVAATYTPTMQGPPWLPPVGWLMLAVGVWALAARRLARLDVVD